MDALGQDMVDVLKAQNARLEGMINARKVRAIEQKSKLKAAYQAMEAEGPDSLADGLEQVTAILPQFSSMIDEAKAIYEQRRQELDAALARVARISVPNAKRARREVNRFFELGAELHNETIEFYYFLLSLKAQHEREATSGPSFSDPKSLGKYLREQLKA
jgi:hypothetical protein